MQNLISKKLKNNFDLTFQIQLLINNYANNITSPTYFYLDFNFDGKAYNNNNFISQNKDNTFFSKDFHAGNYDDTFTINANSSVTLYTWTFTQPINHPIDPVKWEFKFGTFTGIFHYQLTSTNGVYVYDYSSHFYNGTRIVVNAYGSASANIANWGLKYYKF